MLYCVHIYVRTFMFLINECSSGYPAGSIILA